MRGPLVLLVAVLALASPVFAAPAAAELRIAAPLTLSGEVHLASDEGLLLLPGTAALPGTADAVNVTLLRSGNFRDDRHPVLPQEGSAHAADALDGILGNTLPRARPAGPAEVEYLEMQNLDGLTFTTRQAGARLVLAVTRFDEGRLSFDGAESRVREAPTASAGVLPEPFVPPGNPAWLAADGAGSARVQGTVRGLFEGVGIMLQNGTSSLQVDTTEHDDGGHWVAVVRWTGANLRPSAAGPMTLLSPLLQLSLDGALSSPGAWGPVRVDDDARPAQGQSLVARGALDGKMAPGGGAVRMKAQGDLAYLALGGAPQDFARAAAAATGLVAAVGALAYYAPHLRFIAVPLYARVASNELLDNEVRRRVHGHVHDHPGADVKDTAAVVGVSWSTAAYHLARLEREGIMTSRRAGRSKRFFLNGASAQGRAEAIGALRNPTSLAIAELVAARPGLMQKELGEALRLPASTVSWHMRRLRALGIVREERKWRRAEYAPGPLWPELRPAVRAEAAPTELPMPKAAATLPPAAGAALPPAVSAAGVPPAARPTSNL